jgi:SH3 domain protein
VSGLSRRAPRFFLGACLAASLAASILPCDAEAEQAWVGDREVRLQLRTGPSTGHRIIGEINTGDPVTVLSHEEDWTQVQTAAGDTGWIPAGFLANEPPPATRLAQLEEQVASLRAELDTTRSESEQLRTENETVTSHEGEREQEMLRLTQENLELKAGERWPYLITGASILGAGMLLGAIVQALLRGRRSQQRIRF